MKKNKIYLLSLVVAICCSLFAITSCEDMLTVDSGRYVTADKNGLSSPNDSVNSVLGLFRGMQKVGERYILLGEMRADLLDVTKYTPADIRQLSDFKVDSTNAYANPRDYYNIVNNCNFFINRTAGAGSPLKNENALVHAIRTWAYMQIAINWGKVYYFTKPLLTVNDTKETYPVLDINQLSDLLIADLEPYADASYPNYGFISSFNNLPMKVLLGDLYLWHGRSTSDYEKAATYYAEFINSQIPPLDPNDLINSLTISPKIRWTIDNFTTKNFETLSPNDSWSLFTGANGANSTALGVIEFISGIQMAMTPSDGIVCQIPNNLQYFGASNVAKKLWEDQNYVFHYVTVSTAENKLTTGDLRGKANIREYQTRSSTATTSYDKLTYYNGLYKLFNSDNISLYRMGLIFLRYAEAVNRAGYPKAAFAVLKYGLKPVTLQASTKISVAEATLPYVSIFNNDKYQFYIGIHARGCGDADFDDTYKLESFKDNSPDTIQWVENAICTELALETSFEGNRFGDLVRMALRRNDPNFLAKRIASKHEGGEYGRIYSLLSSDKKNWFLPEPK